MRWWVRSVALAWGVVGQARNVSDGRVEVSAQGPTADVVNFWCAVVSSENSCTSASLTPGMTVSRPGQLTCATVQWLPPKTQQIPTGFIEA